MSEFRTKLPIPQSRFQINYRNQILAAGSCFAEHIGNELEQFHFSCLVNPFGIIYHPVPLAAMLEKIVEASPFSENDIFYNGDMWHSRMHHGRFSHPDKGQMLQGINEGLAQANNFLKSANYLLLTLGTANGFYLKNENIIVANCHKMPGQFFEKKRTGIEMIQNALASAIEKVRYFNPDIKIILTVSPVRHLRDGLISNNRSKAALLLATEWLEKRFDQVEYFPAYELVMDDLRDYRFYAKDRMHPTEEAVEYVWKNFKETYLDFSSKEFISDLDKILSSRRHRPLFPNTPSYEKFLVDLRQKEADFISKWGIVLKHLS